MKTVIVPVDFSDTSKNAALYAAHFMKGHYGVTVVLFHVYSKANEEADVQQKLHELKEQLMEACINKYEVYPHQGEDFIEELERLARHRRADLVVMGITGRGAVGQFWVGSNTLKMAQTKVCPVLIIPEQASYRPINHVMLASDFKNTLQSTPSVPIKHFLELTRAELHIVNVDPDHYIEVTEEYQKESSTLNKIFEGYRPHFYFMRLYGLEDAINLFAEQKNIDLIISIRKNESFLDKIFKRSRTKSLTYQSKLPLLVVHE